MSDKTRDLVAAQSEASALSTWRRTASSTDDEAPVQPNESLGRHSLLGWIVLAIFFGGIGTWAAMAPLNGAVVAEAVIKVEGNRKSLQHLEGGIVKEVRVKEGDRVNAGDVLIVLDDTRARSDFEVFSQQQRVLRATEVRLMAELNGEAVLVPPPDIVAQLDNRDMQTVWNVQLRQFSSRRTSRDGGRQVLRERINQLEEQITGNVKQASSFQQQIGSVQKELADIAPLVEKGLITQPRRLQLERSAFALEGQIASTTAEIARAREAIAEQTQQIAQVDNELFAEVSQELRDTQAALLEVMPRLMSARTSLSRMEIASPYSGQVVGLSVFAASAVIRPGDNILDIVPEDDSLTIEARVAVEEIADVHPGSLAEVHLTAYKQRITPMVHGTVIQVSADRLVDERTGIPYYSALLRLDADELAELPHVRLYPGMPAQVMIPTVERTALDYLLGPLTQSFNVAFRQK